VSADRQNQEGKGHTEGCPEKLTGRRGSLWHWTGHGRNGGHGTGGGRQRAVADVLDSREQSERERSRELGRGRKWKRGYGRAGRGVQKGRGGSVVAGERADVSASTTGRSWARG
jgi:outer membrane translocation and assembly module TamA